ncbi:two-component system response regulator [bacterium]|nr:MAG: two-component system response regulator [bacterium]
MAKRILVVDDAKFMRVIIREVLEDAGYEVVGEAETGSEALWKYSDLKPDLMILDIIIPVLEGNVVLGRVLDKYPDAKILIVSAIGQRLLVDKALKSGAAGYIVKPLEPEQLLSEVKRILGE